METIELEDGGLLLYDDSFLSPDFADRYFAELRDHCQWEQKPRIFGHMQPRLIASYGDAGAVIDIPAWTMLPCLGMTHCWR